MAQSWSASNGSWGITITFSEAEAPANTNRIYWSATVSAYADSYSQESTRFTLTFTQGAGVETVNKDRTYVCNGTTISGTTSLYWGRENNGYLSVGFSLYFKGYNSAMSTSGTITGTYKAMYSNVGAPSWFSLYILDPHQKVGNALEGTRYVYNSSSGSHDQTSHSTYQSGVNYYMRVQNITQLQKYGTPSSRSDWKTNPNVGDIRVVASGASAGTQNAVTGYRIYYRVSSNGAQPTTSSYTGYWDTTASNTLSLAPSSIMSGRRGQYISFKAMALGSVSGYNSGLSSYWATIQVNDLPGTPAVTVPQSTMYSHSTTTTIGASYPSHSTNYTGYSVYYSNTADSSTASLVASDGVYDISDLAQGASKNFYFWSWDGLEFSSSYVTKTITKNLAPAISTSYSSTTNYTAKGSNGWASGATASIITNKAGTLQTRLSYKLSGSSSWSSGDTISTSIAKGTTSIKQDFVDWVNKLGSVIDIPEGQDLQLRLYYTLFDGLEGQSAHTEAPPTFSIAGPSTTSIYYNQHAPSTISGTGEQYFSSKIRIALELDELASAYTCTAAYSSSTAVCTVSKLTKQDSKNYVDIVVPDSISGGEQVKFNIVGQIQNSSNEPVITQTLTSNGPTISGTKSPMIKIKLPSLTSVTTGLPATLKMFETNAAATYEVDMNNFLDSDSYANSYLAYGLSSQIKDAVKLYLKSDSNYVVNFSEISKSGDTYACTLPVTNLFSWNYDKGVSVYAGTYKYTLVGYVQNLFGQIIDCAGPSITLDFNTLLTTQTPTCTFYYKVGTGAWTAFNSSQYLQEGAQLRVAISGLKLFSEEALTTYIQGSDGSSSISGTTDSTKTNLNFGNYYVASSYPTGRQNYGTNTITVDFGTMPAFVNSSNIIWDFYTTVTGKVTSAALGKTIYYKAKSMNALYQDTPNINLLSCSIIEENGVTKWSLYGKTLKKCSSNFTITYKMIAAENGAALSPEFSVPEGEFKTTVNYTESSGVGDWASLPVILVAKVVSNSDDASFLFYFTKQYNSNALIAYNITPTVVYRPNRLGINVPSSYLEENLQRTIVIKNNAGTDGISILGTYGDADVRIVDDISTLTTTISLDNFIIDGGEI